MNKDQILELVASSKLKSAIDEVIRVASKEQELKNELLVLKASYASVEKDRRMGIHPRNEIDMRIKQISYALLEIIDLLDTKNSFASSPGAQLPQMIVSYAWEEHSDEIIKKFRAAAEERGIRVVQDKVNGLEYGGYISGFMDKVGAHGHILIVISDKYLKSVNCMYEMRVIRANENWQSRIFPLVLPDAKIYDPMNRNQYTRFWEEKFNSLNEDLRKFDDFSNRQEAFKELDLYAYAKNNIDSTSKFFADMNTLSIQQHESRAFADILDRIE
jgi:hypothetical protein